MLENLIRPVYQKILVNPLASLLPANLSANWITFLALISGTLVAPLLLAHTNITAAIFLMLSGYFDTLDGTVARLQHASNPQGSMLDIISDRWVEFAVIVGLYGVAPLERGWLTLCMLGSVLLCVTTFLVVGIFSQNQTHKSFYYSPGLIERPEAFLFFIAMILLPTLFNFLAITFIFLVTLTAVIRIYQFCR